MVLIEIKWRFIATWHCQWMWTLNWIDWIVNIHISAYHATECFIDAISVRRHEWRQWISLEIRCVNAKSLPSKRKCDAHKWALIYQWIFCAWTLHRSVNVYITSNRVYACQHAMHFNWSNILFILSLMLSQSSI